MTGQERGRGELSRRRFLRLAGLAGIGVAGTGLSGTVLSSCSSGSDDTLKVGVITPQSGPRAATGTTVSNALDAAVKHLNAGGGLEGRKVEVLLRDSGAELDAGSRLYSELAGQPDLIGLLWCGALGFEQVLPRIREDRMPVVAAFEDPFSADQVVPNGQIPSLFQMQLPEIYRHQALADYAANDRAYASIALLYDAELDAEGRTERLVERVYGDAGLQLRAVETFSTEDTDFTQQLLRLQAVAPHVLYLDGGPQSAADIVMALEAMGAAYVDTPTAKGAGWHPHIFGSPLAVGNSEWAELAGQAAKAGTVSAGNLGGLIYLPSYSIASWLREFLGRDPVGGEELAADALATLLEGMKEAGTADHDRVVEGIQTMGARTFASTQFGYAADRHVAFTPDDTVILTLERLRGPVPTDPPYELGTEWGPAGVFGGEAAAPTQLVRPTLEANQRAHPEVMATVLEEGYGTQCTKLPDGTLSSICKVH